MSMHAWQDSNAPPRGTSSAALEVASTTVHEQIRLHLDERGFIPFHPVLAQKYGHKAAVFVGMALYWTRYSLRNHPERGGWFYMSLVQWQKSIGLTRSEQATVRSLLLHDQVLEENLMGRPSVMNYRINVVALAKALGAGNDVTWRSAQRWFQGCHSYYKPLTDIVGNIAAGLYLSFLLQRQRTYLQNGQLDNGCISVSQDEIAQALNLGPKVQRNARERLKRVGLIQEVGHGGLLVRINSDAILMCLHGQATKPLKIKTAAPAPTPAPAPAEIAYQEPAQAPQQAAVNLNGLELALRQLSLGMITAQSKPKAQPSRPRDFLMDFLAQVPAPVGNRQVPKLPLEPGVVSFDSNKTNEYRGFLRSAMANVLPDLPQEQIAVSCIPSARDSAETCISGRPEVAVSCISKLPKSAPYIQREFINTTTTLRSSGGSSISALQVQVNPALLVIPAKLTDVQRTGVLDVLAGAPANKHQQLLDELEGQLRNKPIRNPAGWLYGLIRKMNETGSVVLSLASEIAAERALRSTGEHSSAQAEQSAKALLQPGAIYRLEKTGSLVYLDTTTGMLRFKRVNETWRVLLDDKDIIKAHLDGTLTPLSKEESEAVPC